jgi:hypothetical protein
MPQNQDKTRRVITIDDERVGLPNSVFLAPGTYTINADGSITIGGAAAITALILSAVLSPAQLADATVENWNAGDLSAAAIIEMTSAGSNAAIGGLLATTAVANQLICLSNVGSFDITLLDASAGSAAANQFALNGDKLIPAGTSFWIRRPSAATFWSGIGA